MFARFTCVISGPKSSVLVVSRNSLGAMYVHKRYKESFQVRAASRIRLLRPILANLRVSRNHALSRVQSFSLHFPPIHPFQLLYLFSIPGFNDCFGGSSATAKTVLRETVGSLSARSSFEEALLGAVACLEIPQPIFECLALRCFVTDKRL